VPRGSWYNFWTDEKIKGGKEMWVDADIDSMPVFIKEGSIIPKYPVQQYVDEKKIEEIVLDIYYKEGKENSQFFDDSHDGYDYTKGRFCLRTFKLTGRKNQLVIQQHKEGTFDTDCKKFKLQIHGLPFEIESIQLDNQTKSLEHLQINGCLTMIIEENFTELDLNGKNR
jgi:alpha-glucosidase